MLFRLVLLLGLVFAPLVQPAGAAPHIAIDLNSGNVLAHQQAFDPWHPASLTKIMTAYSVFRALETGEIQPDHPVRISKNARRQPPSRMGYRTGTTMTIDNALKLLIVKSANDIAVAIAESVSGSVDQFSRRMNRDAARLGMTGSKFINPHGLHHRRQVTTARDMALLLRSIHQDFSKYKNLFEAPSVLAPSRTKNGKTIKRIYYSYNLLLERFRGADGFKTGFVCASGYNFAGAATRSGRRVAAIVLGRDSQTSRAVDAAKLIEEGFRQPNDAGTPVSKFKNSEPVPSGPRNMRATLCTQAARAKRYEPGAGQAVINSPWLQARVINKSPIDVELGGTRASPIQLARVPRPTFRPAIASQTEAKPAKTSEPVIAASELRITLPTFRPKSL